VASEVFGKRRGERIIEPVERVRRERGDDPLGEVLPEDRREPLEHRLAIIPTVTIELLHVCEEATGASGGDLDELSGGAPHTYLISPRRALFDIPCRREPAACDE